MLEFEVVEGGQRRTYVVQVSSISTMTPQGATATSIVLTDGRQFSAAVPYERMRDALLTVRNQFVTLIEAA
jgi:hypothetical protein